LFIFHNYRKKLHYPKPLQTQKQESAAASQQNSCP